MFCMKPILIAGLIASAAITVGAQKSAGAPIVTAKVVERPWIGFGIACSYCSLHDEGGDASWHFGGPPVVMEITPGGPAAGSGLALGDTLTTVNGVDIMSADGGLRFAQIKAGVPVRLGFAHGPTSGIATVVPGSEHSIRLGYDTTGGARDVRDSATARALLGDIGKAIVFERALAVQRSQFTGTVAGADIEVRGRNVQVSSDRGTGKLIIQGDSITVTVKPAGGGRDR